jgi:hypothetical protein
MKLTETRLRQIIKEQLIIDLLEQKNFDSAEQLLWETRQQKILNEKWWQKLLGKWSPTDKDIEDEEIADELEDASAAAAKELAKSGKYTKAQAERAVKKYLDADPELDRVDHRDLTRIFFDLGPNAAKDIAAAEAAEDAKGDPPTDAINEPAPEEAKPQTAAQTVVDLKNLIVEPSQRKMLLRGLLTLLTNDSVERALMMLKPEPAKQAVLAFLKQITDMEPKAYKKFKAGMQKDIYNDMIASDGDVDSMIDRALTGDVTKATKEKTGREAGRKASQRVGKLGLSEGVDKELAEKIAILEALNLYFERRLLK